MFAVRLILGMSASLALGATSSAWADDVPRPAASRPDAGVGAANTRVAVARVVAESAKGKVTEISSKLDTDREQLNVIRQRMLGATDGLRELQAAADAAAGRLEARRQEITAESARYAPLKNAYEQAKMDAIKEFYASPEYRSAVDLVTTKGASFRAIQVESIRKLSTTDAYRQAWEAVQSADAAINAAKQQFAPDSPEVAAAVKSAADAHARLDNLRDDRLKIDPNVQIVRAEMLAANSELLAMRTRFMETQLAQTPKVAAAEQALKAEQAQCDALTAAAAEAEKQVADAQAPLKRQNDGLEGDRVGMAELTAEISRLEAELPAAQADAAKAAYELDGALAAATAARQTQGSASASAPVNPSGVVYPPSSTYYAYNPPIIVYRQPQTVYAWPPYSSTYIVPSAPYFWGTARGYYYPSRVYVVPSYVGRGHGGRR